MKKKLLYIAVLLPCALIFCSCSKIEPLPDVAQPVVRRFSDKVTFEVGGTSITTGALKDYEQDSEVIFQLTVTSTTNLSKFFVTTTSDAVSNLSRVLRTEPADAIDPSGNFIKKLNNVVVYYAYHIHPAVPVFATPVVSFNFLNEKRYTGTTSQKFTVIKKGSTNGKLLTVLDLSWSSRLKRGIGCQLNVDLMPGWLNATSMPQRRGAYFSIEYRSDFWKASDAIVCASKVDLVGYLATSSRTNDAAIVEDQWYLVSPSDTVMLTSTYAGSLISNITLTGGAKTGTHTANITVNGVTKLATFVTGLPKTASNFVAANKAAYLAAGVDLTNPTGAVMAFRAINDGVGFGSQSKVTTVKGTLSGIDDYGNVPLSIADTIDIGDIGVANKTYAADKWMRITMREMVKKLKGQGKSLRKVYFKRLDNSTGPDNVTPEYYDLLTHDNEFDVLLGNVVAEGNTVGGPMSLNQVWGFVMDDGRRGLIRTSPFYAKRDATDVGETGLGLDVVVYPNILPYSLYCTIKVQENK